MEAIPKLQGERLLEVMRPSLDVAAAGTVRGENVPQLRPSRRGVPIMAPAKPSADVPSAMEHALSVGRLLGEDVEDELQA